MVSSALAAKPRGSKNPIGARAPGMLSTVKALTAEVVLAIGAGANAAAEQTRAEARTSFIMFVVAVWK